MAGITCLLIIGLAGPRPPRPRAGGGRVAEARVPSPLPPVEFALAEHAPGDELRGVVLARHGDKVFVDVRTSRPAADGNRTRRVLACTRVPGLKRVRLARKAGRPVRRAGPAPVPIGSEVSVRLTSVQPLSGRLSASLVVARRAGGDGEPERGLEQLAPATELRGVVVSQTPYEAFVDCRVTRAGRRGLRRRINARLPLRELPAEYALRRQAVRSEGARRTLRDGDELTVWALEVLPAAGRLTVTMRQRSAEAMAAERADRLRERRKARPVAVALELGSVRAGVVTKRLPYGCLVDVGARSPGLLHASAMPLGRATLARLSVGDSVTVRVVDAAVRREGERSDRLGLAYVQDDEEEAAQEVAGRAGAAAPTARAGAKAASAPASAAASSEPERAAARTETYEDEAEEEAEEEEAEEEEARQAPSIMDDDLDDYFEDKYGY